MTFEEGSAVKDQLKAFGAAKKRREVEASLAKMSDDDFMKSLNDMVKGE